MNIASISSCTTQSIDLFKKIQGNLLNNRIMKIALAIFCCLAVCYFLYKLKNRKFRHLVDKNTLRQDSFQPKDRSWVTESVVNKPAIGETIDKLDEIKQTNFNFTDRTAIDQMLATETVIAYQNASNLEEAQIIFMGERHDLPRHRELEAWIMNHFGKDDDIFLIEGLNYTEEFLDHNSMKNVFQPSYILKKIRCTGWEEGFTVLQEMEEIKEAIHLGVLQFQKEKQDHISNGTTIDSFQGEEIMNKLVDLFNNFCLKKKERDQFLISNIKKIANKYPVNKIFVLAGRSHISEVDSIFETNGTPKSASFIFDHLSTDIKCAAVIFKDKD